MLIPIPLTYGPSVNFEKDRVLVANSQVSLSIDLRSGKYGISWGSATSIPSIYGEARLSNGVVLDSRRYSKHEIASAGIEKVKDELGSGLRVTVHNRKVGWPELLQEFWVYSDRPEVIVRSTITGGRSVTSNWLAPLVTDAPLKIPEPQALQSLFVPYDNDNYVRHSSNGWCASYEVGAIYNDASRHGIVVGSLDHNTWKSAVCFSRAATEAPTRLIAFAGISNKETHDSEPHGMISGRSVSSPRMLIGCYRDWRNGLERYGDLNALVSPALKWTGGVPFGWSSWSGHKTKLNAIAGTAAIDFIQRDLPGLRNQGTATINLDSFWDNLSEKERRAFVQRAHAAGLKAGIYYTPFTAWGKLGDRVQGTPYKYSDIVLKDVKGQPLPRLDGGYPIDPTHPGSIDRVDAEMAYFMRLGFDFVKLDFLTHGALEGRHYDPKTQTGNQAYTVGMRHIVDDLSFKRVGRPVFIALSIAPLFPAGFGHSRRISCDIFANIGATEYLLNSSNYAWWEGGRLYQFNDADSSCVFQPLGEPAVIEAESRSRLTASVISGGIVLDGDNLTKPAAQARVLKIFSSQEILDLARQSPCFRPVSGTTGSKAGDLFEWADPDGKTFYLAAFNFNKTRAKQEAILPARLQTPIDGSWAVHDLWQGKTMTWPGEFILTIPPMDCKLLRFSHLPKGS